MTNFGMDSNSNIRIFKFGGASVKDATAIRNMCKIIQDTDFRNIVIVISAMGKTTNALERLTDAYFSKNSELTNQLFIKIKDYHYKTIDDLFKEDSNNKVYFAIDQVFYHLFYYLENLPGKNYNYEYDRIVSTGEILSTIIISNYLDMIGLPNRWIDASKIIVTDSNYRDANVDWLKTENSVRDKVLHYFNKRKDQSHSIIITQGFIGGTTQGFVTTLGREGSDYSASIIGYSLKATEVTIWKDVDGLLNADPKIFKQTYLLENISYQEAIELSYYGATIIHPKTLKPLLKKTIPLRVRSFYNTKKEGSVINNNYSDDNKFPSYIIKFNQILISIFPKDFSFIAEKNLSRIFSACASYGIKINLMQNSALSFSICMDEDKIKTPQLIKNLEKIYNIKYNTGVRLITIRHYEKANLNELLPGMRILIEQKNRTTLQWVVKEKRRYNKTK